MNKKLIIIFLIILSLILSSCVFEELKISNTINSPRILKSPIQGEWVLEQYKEMPFIEREIKTNIIGEVAYFKDDFIVIGDYFSDKISYSTKNVKTEDYLLYKYKLQSDYLNIEQDRITILSIYSNKQFVLDAIIINKEQIIISINNKFLYLRKTSDHFESKDIEKYTNIEKNVTGLEKIIDLKEESTKTGILIGLKKEIIENNVKKWDYRTIYLKINDLENIETYQVKDILLPRKTGFYDVEIKRNKSLKEPFDSIIIKPRDEIENLQVHNSVFLKNILYIGNDYISIENTKDKVDSFLRVYPLDYLNEDKSLLLSEALEKENIHRIMQDIKRKETERTRIHFNERDFGLIRRNGYWTLVGIVNYKSGEEEEKEDYNIRAVTPNSIVNYDELSIPWSYIKTKTPELVDAFTSPNGDILIVQTYNQIKAYPIINNKIIDKEILKIDIDPRESIIMNEWAVGRYTELWKDEILKTEWMNNN